MEDAIAEIMEKVTSGTEAEQRRYSQGVLPVSSKKSSNGSTSLRRRETISALKKRNHTYKERKQSVKVC